jgi:hypothetical protein
MHTDALRYRRRRRQLRDTEALCDPSKYSLLAFGREVLELIEDALRDIEVI